MSPRRHLPGLALVLVACAHEPSWSPQRAIATWREMQVPTVADANTVTVTDAGDSPDSGESLTAERAYAIALANNPDLAVADARADVAGEEIAVARQLDNPTLRVTHFRLDDALAGRPGINLGLRAPIPRPGSIHTKVAAAKHLAEGARSLADSARWQLRARIYRLFARLALLTADLDEVGRAIELGDERQRQLQARRSRGLATDVELALAAAAQAEALDEVHRLRDELARTEAELARAVGPGVPRRFRVDPRELDIRDLELDLGDLVEQALRARPELKAAQARLGQAEAAVRLTRIDALPWITWAQASYYVGGNNATPNAFGFGLAVDLPLLSWNRGKIRAARAVVRQRRLEERAQIAGVASEVGEALARAQRADLRLQELERGLLPQVDAAARQADAALAAGALGVLDLLDIEARRVAARRLHLAARYERREALIDLEAAIGVPLF